MAGAKTAKDAAVVCAVRYAYKEETELLKEIATSHVKINHGLCFKSHKILFG